MKLIYCPFCGDVLSLSLKKKSCTCGKSYGKYVDELNAIICHNTIPLGFANDSFHRARWAQPQFGWGEKFTAFVIPEVVDSITYSDDIE